jgi:hypothetical protein
VEEEEDVEAAVVEGEESIIKTSMGEEVEVEDVEMESTTAAVAVLALEFQQEKELLMS